MNTQLILTAAFGAEGAIFVAIALPLILRWVPPNQFYGFRTPKTLSDPAIWYSINRSMGIDLAIAGVVIAIAAFMVPVFARAYAASSAPMTIIMSVAVAIVIVRGLWRLRKM